MDFTLDKFYNDYNNNLKQKYVYNKADKRQTERFRAAIQADIGTGFPYPESSGYKLLGKRVCQGCNGNRGYTIEKIALNLTNGLPFPAYILYPDNITENTAAVVAVHGHGYGARDICGLLAGEALEDGISPQKTKEEEIGYQKNFAVKLAQKGFFVIAPEIFGFGEMRMKRDTKNHNESSCHTLSNWLIMLGQSMAGVRVAQTRICIDYLCSMGNIDKNNIGIMGISGGGMVTTFTAALDTRIKTTVISGYANTFKGCVLSIFHCLDNYAHNLFADAEMPDILSLIHPRNLFIESGDTDPIFPLKYTLEAYEYLKNVYTDAPENLGIEIFEGDHQICGNKSIEFLYNTLF